MFFLYYYFAGYVGTKHFYLNDKNRTCCFFNDILMHFGHCSTSVQVNQINLVLRTIVADLLHVFENKFTSGPLTKPENPQLTRQSLNKRPPGKTKLLKCFLFTLKIDVKERPFTLNHFTMCSYFN